MSRKHDFQIKKWKCMINECQNSGLKIKDWCAQNDISKHQYYYWLNKIRADCYDEAVKQLPSSDSKAVTAVSVEPASFVEISPATVNEIPRVVNDAAPVAVIQNGSMRIEIMPNASASFIRQLLEAVRYA